MHFSFLLSPYFIKSSFHIFNTEGEEGTTQVDGQEKHLRIYQDISTTTPFLYKKVWVIHLINNGMNTYKIGHVQFTVMQFPDSIQKRIATTASYTFLVQ
jgi:hypothetical protein